MATRSPPPALRRLWHSERFRAWLAQAVVLGAVLAFAAWLIDNTLDNLARRGIASGFDFLGATAGFGIIFTLIDYAETSSYGRAFLVGLLNTLLVAGIGIVVSTVLGVCIGVARLSRNWLLARLAGVYIEIFRNLPLLLQILFWYFGVLAALPHPRVSYSLFDTVFLNNRGLYLPRPPADGEAWLLAFAVLSACFVAGVIAVTTRSRTLQRRLTWIGVLGFAGIVVAALAILARPSAGWSLPVPQGFDFAGGMVLIPEFVALVIALSCYTAAFIAEIVRAGVLAVPRGQIEAAAAVGLSPAHTLRFVILPQALRLVVPPMTSQYLTLTKNSSLAAAIGYPELVAVFAGTVLNQTGQAVEVIAITMAVYLSISLAIAAAMNLYNRRVMRAGS